MEKLLNFDPAQFHLLFLLLMRTTGLFISAPILSSRNIPAMIKTGTILFLSLILFMSVPDRPDYHGKDITDYFFLVSREIALGALLGIIPRMVFAAIEFAGTVAGFQMGFGIVNVMDPQSQTQVSIIASLKTLLSTLLFISLDGHHIFIRVLVKSYEKVPIAGFKFTPDKVQILLDLSRNIFVLGLQLGAPLIIALFVANIIMGFMARSIPQMNIFVVGMPFTIALGMVLMVVGMPQLLYAIEQAFKMMGQQQLDFINSLVP